MAVQPVAPVLCGYIQSAAIIKRSLGICSGSRNGGFRFAEMSHRGSILA